MRFTQEIKKLRRTGYFPAFLAGAAASSAFPVLHMAVRQEVFVNRPGSPLDILLDANWQMMAMLNILLIVCGTCMMYHTEYADNAVQKMEVLPVRQSSLFLGKFLITAAVFAIVLCIEFTALLACMARWFTVDGQDIKELFRCLGFEWVLLMPTIMASLVIALACRNMWVSLGTGVILTFALSILPQGHLIFALCPYCSPYQLLATAESAGHTGLFLGVCAVETILLGASVPVYFKIRRYFL